jgi:hypothetical protein
VRSDDPANQRSEVASMFRPTTVARAEGPLLLPTGHRDHSSQRRQLTDHMFGVPLDEFREDLKQRQMFSTILCVCVKVDKACSCKNAR